MRFDELAKYIGNRPLMRNLAYRLVKIVTLREWYIAKGLNMIFEKQQTNFSFLDAGCGIGQHVIGVSKRFPQATVKGVEVDRYKVNDLSSFIARTGLENVNVSQGDVAQISEFNQYDIILCNSVLEHLSDDRQALDRFYSALRKNGHILIYVPTQEKRVLKALEKIQKNHLIESSTDLLHDHERYYHQNELNGKMHDAGFTIEKTTRTYNTFGRIAYDVVTLVQYHPHVKWIFPFYLILIQPFILILMAIDFFQDNQKGNGLMVIARKNSER